MPDSFKQQDKREEKGLTNLLKSVFNGKNTKTSTYDNSLECTIDCERTIAIMDLGSNSLRLMIVQILSNNAPVIVNQIKHMVRLGENSFETKLLQEEQINLTIEVLQGLKQTCEQYNVSEIIAIATAAARKADNAKEFVDKVYKATGIQFKIISGLEEARLIYLGISNSLTHSFDSRLFIDIGGGSTEMIVGHSDEHLFLDSLSIGCVLIANQFMKEHKGAVNKKLLEQMQSFIRQSSVHTVMEIKKHKVKEVYASSGTAKTLFELSYKLNLNKLEVEDKTISLDTLKNVIQHICSLTLKEREELEGVSQQRAQVLVAGAAILLTLAEELKVKKIIITPLSLQHGILVDYIDKTSNIDAPQQEKVRKQSVLGLAQSFNYEKAHVEHVQNLALILHDSAVDCGLISYNNEWRAFLEYACILHDIGIAISYAKHYKHSHYIISNSDLLGFTNQEKEYIALLCYFHNKKPSKKYELFNDLDDEIKEIFPIYALFLALAENLDKLHRANIYDAAFMLEDKKIQLYAQQHEKSLIEEHAVRLLAKSMEKIFHKEVEIYFST